MIKVYEAIIFEKDGRIERILYKCDKDRNIELNKKNCGGDYCNHTLDKKYAIDIGIGKDTHITITKHYVRGKLVKEEIDYE